MPRGNALLSHQFYLVYIPQELNGILDLVPRPGEGREDTFDADFEDAFKQDTQRSVTAPVAAAEQEGDDAEEGEEEEQGDLGEGEEAEEEEEEDVIQARQQQAGASTSAAEAKGKAAGQKLGKQKRLVRSRHLLQTCVFSATLTLPQDQRRRLRRGGGGAGGGATLESLMDR